MNRRSFLQAFAVTASGLFLPESKRVYSFARDLRVPSIEFDSAWHKFSITWDGVTARGLIDDQIVVEGNDVRSGMYFERDLGGVWRGRLGNPSFDLSKGKISGGLRVERGEVHVDCMSGRFLGSPLPSFSGRIDSTMRIVSPDASVRLGWGDPREA